MGDDLSWEELTDLLHRAYAEHAAAGMRFHASWQPVSVTRERAARGECWVAVETGRLVGTMTLVPPDRARGGPFYDRPDVASLGQLAVDPDRRGLGLGARLMQLGEDRARALGARHLALDTAEGAARLQALYLRRGYRFVEFIDWRPTTNYRSMVFALAL